MTSNERFEHAYLMLLHWIGSIYHGHDIKEYFEEENIKTIAIYGMGDLANKLMDALKNSDIKVKYGIDKDVAGTISSISEVYGIDDNLPEIDAIVVTPFYAFDEIREELVQRTGSKIISIEEVVWSL